MSASSITDRLSRQLSWEDLDPDALQSLIEMARREDLEGFGLIKRPTQTGDVTSAVLRRGNDPASAQLVAREELCICGLPILPMVLDAYGGGARFVPSKKDGSICKPGESIGILSGPAVQILQAERILLNFLQRLSGVASQTRLYVEALGDSATRLLDTRKTTPGYRVLEKYAVACGGGFNHRIGLFDRVMLKDNHLAADEATGGEALSKLVQAARDQCPGLVIQLEVDSLEQIPPALQAGVDVFLLDNFSLPDLRAAISLIGDRAASEASGGITLESLPALANLGLDFISTGATIHQAVWKDIGLDWN